MMWYFTFLICLYYMNGFSYGAEEDFYIVMEEKEIDNSLLDNYVIYGVMSEILRNYDYNISETCVNDLKNVLTSINNLDMWAIKVLDASGTYRSNFVWGQNAWLGSKSQCEYLNKPPKYTTSPDIPKSMDKQLISTTSPIEMEYKMVFFLLNSPFKVDAIIHLETAKAYRLGLCTPKSCRNDEIKFLTQTFFGQEKTNFQKLYNASMDVLNVRNMDSTNFLKRPDFIFITLAICIVTGLIIVFSFVNDWIKNSKDEGRKNFFRCFSIQNNVSSMFETQTSSNAINSMNGIRTIICCWVIFFHYGCFSLYALDNLPALMSTLEDLAFQPVVALIFYVDVFFVLSALLLSYNFLKDEKTLNEIRSSNFLDNFKLFGKKIIHRYLRLTPVFLFVIAVSHLLAIYIQESSSLYTDETFDVFCSGPSLLNSLLYIHNFFNHENMCIYWSWYLACDMQYYVITLFILFVHARKPIHGKCLYFLLLAVVTFAGIYSNVQINLVPKMDSIFYHTNEFYFHPWLRMHPYLAGAVVGYVMFQIKDKTFSENHTMIRAYWIGASITILLSLFATYFKELDSLSFALGLSFGRYFISLFNGSIVVMCHRGYGGFLNKFLSNRFFVHVNKTTYCMYLLNPVILLYFNSQQESSLHFEPLNAILAVIGVIVLSYISSLVVSPIFEIPFQKLSDEYIIRKKSKPVASVDQGGVVPLDRVETSETVFDSKHLVLESKLS